MAVNRMNREQFFRAMSAHDDAQLRKTLWNLYWRGAADVRRRIEAELAGDIRPAKSPEPPHPQTVHDEIAEFVALARAGAYLGRDRRVSPKERIRWRFTFKQLATDAQEAEQYRTALGKRTGERGALAEFNRLLQEKLGQD